MLKVKDVHFSRGRRKILDGVSFDLPEGNLMALLGPSGCGKTTLLRLIAGFERLPQGEIEIKGQVVASGQGTHTSAYDRRVGFVFQNYALFPHMSVYDNITFGVPPNSSQLGKTSLAQELLEVFEIAHLKHKKPYEISGGEQQRVAIARALFPQPKLLLMDEPLAHLDSELRLRMIRELKARLTELKVTCVMVTHSQKEAFEFCDTLLAMTRSAGPFQIGSPQEVYEHPQVRQIAEITGEGSFFTSARSGTTFQNIWGEFELRRSEPELQFFVRPENVVEGEGPEAVVQSVTYRGHEVFVELEASASKEKILMSRSPLAPRLTRGQRLRLGLSKEGAWLK